MKLQDRNLSIDMQGDDVRLLHSELRLLTYEIPDEEFEKQYFGKGTYLAVQWFQQRVGLEATGEVDERTAERINAEVDAQQPARPEFLVSGYVQNADKIPLVGLIVRAYDINHRVDNLLLGEKVTNEEGLYEILYSAEQFKQFEKPRADLLVVVLKAEEEPLEKSSIRFGAEAVEKIDFIIDREAYRSPSEYERFMTILSPFLQDDLTEDEIEYVVGKTGIDRQHVDWLVQAQKLAKENQPIPPDAFYGWFCNGLDIDPSRLWTLPTDTLITTLKMAIERRIVPSNIGANLDEIGAHIEKIKLDNVLQSPVLGTAARLGDLLDTLQQRLNPSQQHAIAAAAAELRPEDPKLVERINSIPDLAGDANRIARTLRLGALTEGHLPLTQALQSHLQTADADGETLRPLAALGLVQWINLAYAHGVPEGAALTEVAYAKALAANVERLHPTAALAAHLKNGRRLANQPVLAEVGTFLQDNPDFDIVTANLNTLTKQTEPGSVEEAKHEQLVEGLRRLSHIKLLGASWDEAATLMEKNTYLPHQLLDAGPGQLTALFDGQIAPERAIELHQQAKNLHDITLAVFTAAFSPLNAPNILPGLVIPGGPDPVNPDDLGGTHGVDPRITQMREKVSPSLRIVPRLPPTKTVGGIVIFDDPPLNDKAKKAIADQPTLQALFGAQESCACGHCNSVLGPAAYFVDVLQFINKAGLLNTLRLHRPELEDIELSCDNSNTEVPTIDLALEILENAVVFPLDVKLEADADIAKEMTELVSPLVKEYLEKTVRKLSDKARVKQEGETWEWTVVDGHRRWKLTAQLHDALIVWGEELNIGELKLPELIADLDQGTATLLAQTNFNQLIASSAGQPADLISNYNLTIIKLTAGQSWHVEYQFVVQVLTFIEPVPKLVFQTQTGVVWYESEAYDQFTIEAINDELSQGHLHEVVWWLLADRFNVDLGLTVVATGTDIWTITSHKDEVPLRFVPMSLKVTSLTYQSGDPNADAVAEPENHNPEAYETLKNLPFPFPWSLPLDLPLEAVRLYLKRALSSRRRLIEVMIPIDQKVRENMLAAHEVLHLNEAEANLIAPESPPSDEEIYQLWGMLPNTAASLSLLKNVSILLQQARLSFEETQALIATQFVLSAGALHIEPEGSCKPSEMTLSTLTPKHLDYIHRFVRLQRRLGWSTRELDIAIEITTGTALNSETLLQLANLVRLHESLDLSVSAILAWWNDPVAIASRTQQLARALGTTKAELDHATALFGIAHPFSSPSDTLEFCERAMQFQLSSITFEDARYLLTHHETPGSNCTLDAKQLMQLEDAAKAAWQSIPDAAEKTPALAADEPDSVTIRRARTDAIIAALATRLGAERELVDDLLRTRLRHPSSPNNAAVDVFLSSVGDFIDLFGLVGKLVTKTNPRSLSGYLLEQFSGQDQEILKNPASTALQQQLALVPKLNEILKGTSIYESRRFAGVTLSMETRRLLIQQDPTDEERIHLNRLLLEDAYPLEIVKHRPLDMYFMIGDLSQPHSAAVKSVLMHLYKTVFICDALNLKRTDLNLLRKSTADENGFTVLDINTLPVSIDMVPAKVDDLARLLVLAQLRRNAADLLHQYAGALAGNIDTAHTLLATAFALEESEVKAAAAQLHITTAEQHRDPLTLTHLIELLTTLKQLGATVGETRNQTNDPGHPIPAPNVANGLTAPSPTDADASAARTLLHNKYGESSWHDLIKPISDALRERQRTALVDYLVNRDHLRDADDLYERYLIDFQTGSCMKTTRLLQATAAAQLFIQRVLLNLEAGVSLTPDKRVLWKDWMSHYRVWEANRKVFLFPENWLLPELRDDKTAIFRQMESTLTEQEPSTENTRDALLGYLDDLGDLAQISIIAMYEDLQNIGATDKPVWKKTLYVVGRTPNSPYRYFWRSCTEFGSAKMSWNGWEALELDNGNDFIMPFVLEGDLHIAWPIFRKTVVEKDGVPNEKTLPEDLRWEVQIAWMRRTTHGWIKRKIGTAQLNNVIRLVNKDEMGSFAFRVTKDFSKVPIPGSDPLLQEKININCYAAHDYLQQGYGFNPHLELNNADLKFSDILDTNPTRVFFSVWGFAYKESVENGVTIYRAASDMKVTVNWQYKGNLDTDSPTSWSYEMSPNPTTGEFLFDFKYPGTNGQHDGQVLNGGPVTLTFHWPSGDKSITKSLVKDGIHYKFWWWHLSISDGIIPNTNEYPEGRAVEYKPAGSFIVESGRDLGYGATPPPFDQVGSGKDLRYGPVRPLDQSQVFVVNGNRFYTASDEVTLRLYPLVPSITFGTEGMWSPLPALKLPFFVTHAIQPSAPEWLSPPPSTPIWYLQEKDTGFFLQKREGSWRALPDGQPFALSYRSTARLSTSVLFKPAIQKYLHYRDAANKFDRDAAYANYNWELFLHVPLAIADYYASQQRFEDARRWLHAVFDPTTDEKTDNVPQYWRFLPFHNDSLPDSIAQMLTWLADLVTTDPNHIPTTEFPTFETKFGYEIDQWKDNPFMPHVVARLRPSAYQWHTFFAYLDVLIGWGDQLFRRDTRESVNEATLLYILAAKLLGPRPLVTPEPTPPPPQTYRSLSNSSIDAFGNAWVTNTWVHFLDLPGVKKLSRQSQQRKASTLLGAGNGGNGIPTDELPPIPTSALTSLTALAFCIPENEKVTGYYDLVEKRLSDVRNCRNIEGVFRELPLYEPPIDPLLLIRARAAGLDLNDVLGELYAPLPNYRFNFTLQKALELCAELKALAGALLAALEKKDAEELTLLRSSHEIAMLTLVQDIRQKQIDEAESNITALQQSEKTIIERFSHYQKLMGKSGITKGQDGLPVVEQSSLLAVATDATGDVSGLGLSSKEVAQLILGAVAHVQTQAANAGHVIAGVFSMLPNVWAGAIVAGQTFGGSNMGSAASAIARAIESGAAEASYLANLMGTFDGYERRQDEWVHQSKLAVAELKQLDKQILAAQIRKDIAQHEFDNHVQQIENAQKVDEFMRGKFTNQQLYRWMSSQIAGVYFRTYQLALDQAKRTERAYQHELGLDKPASFVKSDSWDSLKKGLLAGDHLHHDLKRMESAYLERNVREFEITKHISLLQLDPAALINLRETGTCNFSLPEVLFDLDFPTHYLRRIKSVSLSIPCVTGPYASVSAKLVLTKHKIRYQSNGDLQDAHTLITAMVTSSGQMDNGMFETNLRDERYLPFEGAGATSDWELSLPKEFHQFDYSTISDVVLHLRYTAKEGSTDRTEAIRTSLNTISSQSEDTGLAQLFSLRYHFPTQWHQLQSSTLHKADFAIVPLHFPLLLKGKKIKISKVQFEMMLKTPKASALGTRLESPAATDIGWSPSALLPTQSQYFTGNWSPPDSGVVIDLAKEDSNITLRIAFNEANTTDSAQIEDLQDILLILHYTINAS